MSTDTLQRLSYAGTRSGETIGLAVVGLKFGVTAIKWMQERYRTTAFKVALVCDRDEQLAAHIGRHLGVPWTSRFEDVLTSPLNVVALFTPPQGRSKLLRELIRAGKDVMTTKPFELESYAARELLEEAHLLGRIIHLNSPNPAGAPDLRCIQAWQERHKLGRAVALRADVWASYNENADGSWYDDPLRCPVAPIFRLGIYLINDAISLLGPVEQVFVMTSRIRTGRPTPDQALLSLRHSSGALTAITASFCVDDGASWRNSLTLNYERGTVFRNAGPSSAASGGELILRIKGPEGDGHIAESRMFPTVWSGEYDWDQFALAVVERRMPTAEDVASIVNGIAVVEAMARSESTGLPTSIRPRERPVYEGGPQPN